MNGAGEADGTPGRTRDVAGRVLAGRYELVEAVGEGGMAVVWRATTGARDGAPRRTVAIKRMRPALVEDPDFLEMFVEEARVATALDHPNVVDVHALLEDEGGSRFLVMEWVDGLDLGQVAAAFRRGAAAIPWEPVAVIGAAVLRGLEAGHDRQDDAGRAAPIFHRDVTPSNVLIGRNGVPKLADFGLARAMDRATITDPGIVKGKLAYVAPELVAGRPASARSDLYSLGVVLWEALAGRRRFRPANDLELFVAVGRGEVPPIHTVRAGLPEALSQAIDRALAPNEGLRHPSSGAMAEALEAIVTAHGLGPADVVGLIRAAESLLDLDASVRPDPADG